MLVKIVQLPKADKSEEDANQQELGEALLLIWRAGFRKQKTKERVAKSSEALLNFLLKNVCSRNHESSVHNVVLAWKKISKLKYELSLKFY